MRKRCALILLALSLISTGWAKTKKRSFDEQLAQFAAELGTNRAATRRSDGKGKLLLQLAAVADPSNECYKQTMGVLTRLKKLEPVPTKMTEERLLEGMLKQAEKLRKSGAVKKKDVGRRALLYYSFVAKFQPDNETAQAGQAKLNELGIKATLDELLLQGPITRVPRKNGPLKKGPELYADSKAPKKWIDFAMARDKLSVPQQAALMTRKYAELCPPVKYKAKTGQEMNNVPIRFFEATNDNGFQQGQITKASVGGPTLNTLWPLHGLPLKRLKLHHVRGRELDLAPLALVRLEELYFNYGEDLTKLKNIDKLPDLTFFGISGAKSFSNLRQLAGLKLKGVSVGSCPRVTKLDGLDKIPTLESLSIVSCPGVTKLDLLSKIPSLKTLVVARCPKVRDLAPLRKLQLTRVALSGCESLSSIKALEGMPITRIEIIKCPKLKERDLVHSLKKMPELKTIYGLDKAIVDQVLKK